MSISLGQAIGYITLDTTKFANGLTNASTQLSNFQSKTKTFSSNVSKISSSLKTAGTTMTKTFTVPLAGIGIASVKTAATFESEMSKVSALSGATGKDLDGLKKTAQEWGAKTKFSASEAAQGMQYMALAGWNTKQMTDGLPGILNLAAAADMDLASASDIVTDALSAFGLSAEDSTHFADVLAQTSRKSNTDVTQMGEAFKYVAPLCGTLGWSVEDCSKALGLMANQGIKSSSAGTSLRMAISNLISPTDKQSAAMERLGLEMLNQDGTMKSMDEVLTMLRNSFSGLSEDQQASAASTIFGKNAMSGMLAIINASQTEYDNLGQSIKDCDGASQEMADTLLNNLNGQITIIKSSLEGIAIKIGEALMPVIKELADKLQDLLNKINGMSDEQIQQVVKIAAIVAAIGPLLLIVSKVLSIIGTLSTVIGTVSGVLSSLSSMLALVAGGAATFGEAFAVTFPVLSGVLPILAGIVAAVAAFALAWKTDFGHIQERTKEVTDSIKSILEGLEKLCKKVLSAIRSAWDSDFAGIRTIVTKVFGVIETLFDGFFKIVSKVFSAISKLINGDFKGAFGDMKDIVKIAVDTVKNVFGKIVDIIGTIISNVISAVVDFAKDLGKNIKDGAKNAFDNFVDFMGKLPERAGYFIGNVIGHVVKFASEFPAKAKEAATNFFNNLIDKIKELPGKIKTLVTNIVEGIKTFVKEFPAKAQSASTEFFNNLVNGLKELPGKVMEIGGNIVKGIWNGITNAKQWLLDQIGGFASGVIKGFKDALGIHSPSKVAEKEVGENIALGVVKGIKNKKDEAKKSASQISRDIVTAAKDAWETYKQSHKNTLQSEVEFWKKIVNSTSQGTSAHTDALKKYNQAVENLRKDNEKKKEEDAAKSWKKDQQQFSQQQKFFKMSLSVQVAYWDKVRKTYKKGTDERIAADKKYLDTKKELNEKLKELDKKYAEDCKQVQTDLNAKIKELTNEYNETFNSRKESILSAFSLFEKYENDTGSTKEELTDNLKSQVDAIKNYSTNLQTLYTRGILPENLFKEISDMGVDASANIEALNTMTDEELTKYVALWKEKNRLAKQETTIELAGLKEETAKAIENARLKAEEKLIKLNDTYKKNLQKLGVGSKEIMKKAGSTAIYGLIEGIKSKKTALEKSLASTLSTVEDYAKRIQDAMNTAKSVASSASSTVSTVKSVVTNVVNGSHRLGLDRVPYDGYIAELHEGERVLTKQQAKQQDGTKSDVKNGDTFIFNSPKKIDEREAARQLKRAKKELALVF